jgi:hypothetical protein
MVNSNRISKKLVKATTSVAIAVALLGAPIITITNGVADTANSYVTLSSFSGHPDTQLTVSGGNFAHNEPITIIASQNGSTVASSNTTANQYGEFSGLLSLPAKLAQGAVSITATGQTSGLNSSNSYYASPFTPILTPSSTQTTPYGNLTVAGAGYDPSETVDLNLAGSTTTVKTDASGSFSKAVINTPSVPAASYTLVGVGEASGASAVAYEYINAFYPSAAPSSYYVMPVTQLGFNGSGFAANEAVTVTEADSGVQVSNFVTDANGSFNDQGAFLVPGDYAGQTKKFILTGKLSHATTTTTTAIGQYYPSVSPVDYYVLPGSPINFNGSGFVPGESIMITASVDGIDAEGGSYAPIVADEYGNVTAAGAIDTFPYMAGHTITFTLTGQTSHGSGSVSVQVGSYNPSASPSGYYVMPGTVITFNGSGYAPSEVVTVFSGIHNVASFNTDETGSFSLQGGVPVAYDQANTSISYTIVGSVSNQPISFNIGVGQLQTQLTPSSYYVLPYANFDVTVTGFAPNETVSLNTGAVTTTDAFGSATFKDVSLPYTGKSSATLTATGATSLATATASIGLGNYNPNVVADNYYAKSGTTDGLTGSGFAPGELVTITAGSATQTVNADTKGAFKTSLVLPFTNKNSLSITSTGSKSNASTLTTLTLAPYQPQVAPSTYYAKPGTALSFTGSGFVPNENVTIDLNHTKIGAGPADAKGNFALSGFTLPFGAKTAVYTVTGEVSGSSTVLTIGLAQFYVGVQLSNYYGNGGSVVAASGNGYAPNERVFLTSGSSFIANAIADKNGAFSTPITIPYAAPGKLVITAAGETSQASAITGYTVAQIYNSVELGSYAVPAGKTVTITGSGFFPGETIKVSADRGGISYSFKADTNGSLNDSGLVLPSSLTEGMLTLTIASQNSYTSHDITLYVQDKNVQ